MTIEEPYDDPAAIAPEVVHLRGDAVSVILAVQPLPSVVYWGAALPAGDDVVHDVVSTASPAIMNSSFDAPRRVSLLPGQHDGWSGTPGIEWHRGARGGTGWTLVGVEASPRAASFVLASGQGALRVLLDYRLQDSGVLAVRATVRNDAEETVDLGAVRLCLPLPQRAAELLDFTGRWSGERRAQRQRVRDGGWRRATHRGRPGHDAPFLTAVGTPGFGHGRGEVWAAHVAWSGNQEHLVERLPEGFGSATAMLAVGEGLEPGEIRLGPGDEYRTPTGLFAYSGRGLDGVAQAFHREGRAAAAHPDSPRPLVLNTWEAVYFDHDLPRLLELAERAAEVGVERFVLDDGWFRGRRDDHRGLGDWTADPSSWPHGLGVLADAVHDRGMQFGLWFEPEMVNLDSDLAREHPDWILGGREVGGLRPWRHQHVLDLANPEAFAHIYARMDEAISRWGVDFVKWDHNRDLHDPVSALDGAFSAHRQTEAFYRLIDALRAAHPGLEIESCASGGARIDAGVMQHAQRVWASDTNDPVERVLIQQNTGLVLPPEVVGVHVGPAEAHTTHRVAGLSFRLATALFGHAGIEWDLTRCTDGERDALRRWSAMYRELRPLLHGGVTSHADDLDEGALLTAIASEDRRHALAAWTRLEASAAGHSPRVRIPGLDPALRYEVRVRDDLGLPPFHEVAPPAWLPLDRAVEIGGEVLTAVGVPLPVLNPASTLLLEFRAILDSVN